MKKKTIGITGASGFIGRHFVHRLIREGHQVKAFVRHKESIDFLASEENLNIIEGDICDSEKAEQWIKNCDAVIHLAAGTKGKWKDYYHATVKGTELILRLAEEHHIKSLVHMSSVSVYDLEEASGRTVSEHTALDAGLDLRGSYARSKALADRRVEEQIENAPSNIAVLRAGLVYAENMASPLMGCGYFRGRWGVNLGMKDKSIPFVHVDDLYRATMASITQDTRGVYNIVCENQPTTSEILKLWNKFSKQKVRAVFIPKSFFTPAKLIGRFFPRRSFLGKLTFLLSRAQKNIYYSPDKARRELGFKCDVDIRDTLKSIVSFREGKIKIALIGCGFATRTLHVPAIAKNPRIEVVAVFDANQEASSALQTEHFPRAKVIASLRELSKLHIDFAVVAVPPRFHSDILKELIKIGVHSIVEKPALLSLSDTTEISEIAKKANVRIAVVHNYRFRKASRELMNALRRKGVPPSNVRVKFWSGPVYEGAGSWRKSMPYALLYEMGYHFLDIATLAGGGGKANYVYPEYENETLESLKAEMTTPETKTQLDLRLYPPYSKTEIEAEFKDESLVLRFYPENFFRLSGHITPVNELLISIKGIASYIAGRFSFKASPHGEIYELMIRAVRSPAERPPVTLADTLPVMEMIEALKEKAEAKK